MRSHAKVVPVGPSQRWSEARAETRRGNLARSSTPFGAKGRGTSSFALAFAIATLALLAIAPGALAAKTVIASFGTSETGTAGTQFSTPRGIALNTSGNGGVPAGTFYAIDANNRRIQQFSPSGDFTAAWGWGVATGANRYEVCSEASSCHGGLSGNGAGELSSPQGIAVDQANGNVYVSDAGQRRVNVFSATGTFYGGFGWGAIDSSAALQFCTTVCGAPGTTAPATGNVPGGQFGGSLLAPGVGGLAVDSASRLYVANRTSRRIDVFTPTLFGATQAVTGIAFTRSYGWGALDGTAALQTCNAPSICHAPATAGAQAGNFATNSPADVALDSTGSPYALDNGNKRIQKLDLSTPTSAALAAGFDASAAITAALGTGALDGVAIDPDNDHLFVSGSNSTTSPANQIRVAETSSAGAAIEVHGTDLKITSASLPGLAVAPRSLGGTIYIATASTGTLQGLYALNDTKPSLAATDAISAHSATVHGQVVSNDVAVDYRFEISADGSNWTKLPASDATVPATAGTVAVEQQTGSILHANTQYLVRLVATRPAGAMPLVTPTGKFTTLPAPPAVDPSVGADSIGTSSARLKGAITPEGKPTTYQFQYLTQAAYETNGSSFTGPSLPQGAPLSPAAIGSGIAKVIVAEKLSGLRPETTYRFRLLATNEAGTAAGGEGAFTTHATEAPPSGSCPNERFRTGIGAQLPECRAFEQASPVDKNGNFALGKIYTNHAANDGNAVSFAATGSIPGSDGAQNFGTYLATRDGGNWNTQGMLPPASAGSLADVTGWTPSFSSVLSFASDPTIGKGFFSHASASGALSTVVPYVPGNPNFGYLDAADDGSRVLLQADTALPLAPGQPAPAPGKRNIYAWNKATDQLYLAGVLPDGTAPAAGALAGTSGTQEYLQDGRAVSIDGESIFFTDAGNGQLYLREHAAEPGEAATLHVSASQRTGGTDPGGPLPANFLAGSDSGQVGLFSSPEELTDDAHTRATPHVISSASSADGRGVNPTLLSLTAGASAIAVDASHIYWVDPIEDRIGRADLDGQNADPAFITGADNPHGIAVGVGADSGHLYWTNRDDDGDGNGTIGRADVSTAGCAPAAPPCDVDQAFISGASSPRGIDASSTNLYWTNQGSTPAIGRADVGGGSVEQSFIGGTPGEGVDLAVDPAHNHIFVALGESRFIACRKLDDGGIAADCGNELGFLPVRDAGEIAVDAGHLYWTNSKNNSVARSDLDGDSEEASFAVAPSPSGIAVDGSRVYWGSNPSGRGADLYHYDAASGALTDLVPDHASLLGADVVGALGASADGSYVYYVANGVPDGIKNSPNVHDEEATPGNCTHGFEPAPTGICNLYVTHFAGGQATTTFIARLDARGVKVGDVANWVPSNAALGTPGTFQKMARVTPDGKAVLFLSQRNLTTYDNGEFSELYLFQVGDDGATCVSCSPTGAAPKATPALGSINLAFVAPSEPALVLSRNLSDDGGHVFFESLDPLVGMDTDDAGGCPLIAASAQKFFACQDVYEWQANGVEGCAKPGGCLHLLSDGSEAEPAFFIDASTSGEDAFIATTARLVAQDRDDLYDVYDAKVGGGLESQNAASGTSCEADGCRPPALPPPTPPNASSNSFSGPGNERPSRARGRHKRAQRNKHRKHSRHKAARRKTRHGAAHHHRTSVQSRGVER